jgi:hypothetical protein
VDYIKCRLEHGRMKKQYAGPETYVKLALEALSTVDWNNKTLEIEKFLFRQEEAVKVTMFSTFASEATITSWLSQKASD